MTRLAIFLPVLAIFLPGLLHAGGTVRANPPSECKAPDSTCGCDEEGGSGWKDDGTAAIFGGNDGDGVENGCVKVRLGLGRTMPWTGSLACSLKVFADDDSPEIFTAESLHAVLGGYSFKRLGQKAMADGETPAEVVFSHPNGESVTFTFAEGESYGRPKPGVHGDMDERVLMVDAGGWAVTKAPVYYDLHVGDGTRRRFLATDATGRLGALVSITDARGVETTPEQMGVDIVHTPAGVRQFLTPSRLADVTHAPDWQGYDVAVYALGDEIPAKDAATGLYALPPGSPVKVLSIRRGSGGRAVATFWRGGSEPREYVFDYAMGEWSLTRPSGVREERERVVADSQSARTVSEVREPSGTRLSRTVSNYRWMPWGFAMTNRVEGTDTFDGAPTANAYFANPLNQYTTISNLSASVPLCEPTYDADGNTTSDERFTYFWNGENRLVCASNDEVVVTYAYDHRGRMVRKGISHRGTEAQGMGYLWDDWNIIREVQWPGASGQWPVGTLATSHCPLVTDYVWGLDVDGTLQGAGGVGGLLAVQRSDCATCNSPLATGNCQLYFPTYDANGNVGEYVTTNGEIVAHYDYSPFGEPLVASGPLAATFTHQFSTKPYCAATGFSEYQMRKYRPDIGRWMNRDPLGITGGINISAFVVNSPLGLFDRFGAIPWKCMCYEAKNFIRELLTWDEFRDRHDIMLRRGCSIRTDCSTTCSTGVKGQASITEGRIIDIVLCTSLMKQQGIKEWLKTFRHEFSHAYDLCFLGKNFQCCDSGGSPITEEIVCTELRAYKSEFPADNRGKIIDRACSSVASECSKSSLGRDDLKAACMAIADLIYSRCAELSPLAPFPFFEPIPNILSFRKGR